MNRRRFLCFAPAVPLLALAPSATEPVKHSVHLRLRELPADAPVSDYRDYIRVHNEILDGLHRDGAIVVDRCAPLTK